VTDRLRALDDAELGRALTMAGRWVAWPAEPDLAPAVIRTIARREDHPASPTLRRSSARRRRAVVLAIAAVLLLAAAALAAKLVIDLGALSLEIVPGRPTALPSVSADAADFGTSVGLDEAAAIAGFTPLVPDALGTPDRVWVDRTTTASGTSVGSERIVLAWRPGDHLPRIPGTRWGAVLMEFAGDVNAAAKFVYAETGSLRQVTVNGQNAFWTSGRHELDLLGPDGIERYLVTGNVLLWNETALTLRLETALGARAAIEIAGSISI
jgi:hypothetical protein